MENDKQELILSLDGTRFVLSLAIELGMAHEVNAFRQDEPGGRTSCSVVMPMWFAIVYQAFMRLRVLRSVPERKAREVLRVLIQNVDRDAVEAMWRLDGARGVDRFMKEYLCLEHVQKILSHLDPAKMWSG